MSWFPTPHQHLKLLAIRFPKSTNKTPQKTIWATTALVIRRQDQKQNSTREPKLRKRPPRPARQKGDRNGWKNKDTATETSRTRNEKQGEPVLGLRNAYHAGITMPVGVCMVRAGGSRPRTRNRLLRTGSEKLEPGFTRLLHGSTQNRSWPRKRDHCLLTSWKVSSQTQKRGKNR